MQQKHSQSVDELADNPAECLVDGCCKKAARGRKGWCLAHYTRWRNHGDPAWVAPVKPPRVCSVEDCERLHEAHGLCATHNRRVRRFGSTDLPPPVPARRCLVPECSKDATTRGWCGTHYQRWRDHGDPLLGARKPLLVCCVEGCSRRAQLTATGLCNTHNWRFEKHGDVHHVRGLPKPGEPKPCCRCGVVKPVEDFCLHPTGIGGRAVVCKACKKQYDADYREANRTKRRESNSRRRAVIRGVDAERVTAESLWIRDGGVCALCDEPVNRHLRYPEPMSWSIDHIVPLVHGGLHTYDNTRITHLHCNVRRGAARGELCPTDSSSGNSQQLALLV